ncbi:MAG: GGDEF domain-containing protein [Planctomycetes bacterium]|nr:GGDEF domain-containing protein [Planctomycetota bacterium]
MSHDQTPEDLGRTSLWRRVPPGIQDRGRRAWLTVLAGGEAGRVYSLSPGRWLLGRSGEADLVFNESEVSRRHVEIEISHDGTASVRDAGSTNGTLIGSRSLGPEFVELRDGAKLQVGGALVLRFSFRDLEEERFERELYETLTRDPLTGVHNKRYFELRLEQEFAHAQRHGSCLGLAMLDLDDFKVLNDTWGHAAGDHVLRTVAAVLDDHLREDELLARCGGEEFAVLLRSTSLEEARLCAERLRRLIDECEVHWEGERLPVTGSFGVAVTEGGDLCSAKRLFIEADAYLYRAKNSGKNRVCAPERAA